MILQKSFSYQYILADSNNKFLSNLTDPKLLNSSVCRMNGDWSLGTDSVEGLTVLQGLHC